MVTIVNNGRFSLGIEGEAWNENLECMIIPVPGTGKSILAVHVGPHYLVAHAEEDGTLTVSNDGVRWRTIDSLLMTAAYIRNYLDECHAKQEQGQVVGQ